MGDTPRCVSPIRACPQQTEGQRSPPNHHPSHTPRGETVEPRHHPLSAPGAAEHGEMVKPAIDWFQDQVKPWLNHDGTRKGTEKPILSWHEWPPGIIRTVCRRFTIVRVFIPDHDGPQEHFLLFQADPASTRAYGPGDLGYSRGNPCL